MRAHRLLLPLALFAVGVVGVGAQAQGVREVSASERTLISLTTKLRYTTMILLPEQDEILDVVCGDHDFWVISATQNIAHVKPAKEGAATNLNLVTASGRVYSFLLTEQKTATPDLKVYVTADPSVSSGPRKYYSAADVSALQAEVTAARASSDAARQRADEAIATFKQQYPAALQFVYGTAKYERPFLVRSVWHDGQFTYIKADARELPALYEMKDGEPALVNFQVQHGTYVVPKVLDRAYLALGKARDARRAMQEYPPACTVRVGSSRSLSHQTAQRPLRDVAREYILAALENNGNSDGDRRGVPDRPRHPAQGN